MKYILKQMDTCSSLRFLGFFFNYKSLVTTNMVTLLSAILSTYPLKILGLFMATIKYEFSKNIRFSKGTIVPIQSTP